MKQQKRFFRRFTVVTALVLVLAVFLTGCYSFGVKTGDSKSSGSFGFEMPQILNKPQTENKPKPVSEPASGTILSGYSPKDASQITVTLAPTGSCVAMLKDTSGITLLSFYVRGGDTVTVDVPAEQMYVHFACGTTWYGEELLFGEDTFYQRDEALTDFSEYSWTYDFDPMAETDFVYEDEEEDSGSYWDTYEEPDSGSYWDTYEEPDSGSYWDTYEEPEQPAQNHEGYIANLGGNWESVYLKDGNSTLNISALAFSQTVYNVTEMTVNMNVSMNAGTSCKDWQVWGRSGNTFVKIAKIYLAAGDGYTSQTITFDSPVSFDAIAITPTVVGGYSWSMGMSVTDVWYQP